MDDLELIKSGSDSEDENDNNKKADQESAQLN